MILVDTSVWIDHLRNRDDALVTLLDEDRVLAHSFVVGELACGNLRDREQILALFASLPQALVVEDDEVLHFISRQRLFGLGLGWIDVHLLASARVSRDQLWTHDKRLAREAQRIGVDFAP